MLKIISIIFVVLVGYCFWSFNHISSRERKDLGAELNKITIDKKLGKVLVVYYSLDGNTHNIASRIQKMTNADVFEIETIEPYPSAPAYYWVARQQIKNNELPKLKNAAPNVSSYDLIIVGSPVWWYTVSSPMLAFLDECDFKGKAVAAFATQGGNVGTFFADFKKKIKNAKIIEEIDFSKVSAEKSESLNEKVSAWLDKIKSATLKDGD